MNKSELVEALANNRDLTYKKSEEIVNIIFDAMSDTLSKGDRIEISLRLPHHVSPTVIEHATVRWGRAQTYGIEFEGVSLIADSRLQKFMARASKPATAQAC